MPSKTSKTAIERAHRQEEALKYRLAGAHFRAIADHLGVSKSTAHRLVADALEEIKREPAEAVIDMELQRLDRMLAGLWKTATNGDTKAVGAALRIMERRAKYLGLDSLGVADSAEEARAALESLMTTIVDSIPAKKPDGAA